MLNFCSNAFPKGGWTHSLPAMWRKTLLQPTLQLKKRRRGVKVRWQMILTWFAGSKYNVVIDQTSGRDDYSGGGAKQPRDGSSRESARVIGVHSKFLVLIFLCKLSKLLWLENSILICTDNWFSAHGSSLVNISFAKEPTTGKLFQAVSCLALWVNNEK